MTKEWRPVNGFEGLYEVSNWGEVRSVDRVLPNAKYGKGRTRRWPGKTLSPSNNGSTGHQFVRLWKNKKPHKMFVHRIVLQTFVGPCPEGMECLHKDDNPSNNHVKNLRWGTRSENAKEGVKNGRNHNSSKTHCKRGHFLGGSNLLESVLKKGRRECRSCHSARRIIRDNPKKYSDVQKVSDRYYEKFSPLGKHS